MIALQKRRQGRKRSPSDIDESIIIYTHRGPFYVVRIRGRACKTLKISACGGDLLFPRENNDFSPARRCRTTPRCPAASCFQSHFASSRFRPRAAMKISHVELPRDRAIGISLCMAGGKKVATLCNLMSFKTSGNRTSVSAISVRASKRNASCGLFAAKTRSICIHRMTRIKCNVMYLKHCDIFYHDLSDWTRALKFHRQGVETCAKRLVDLSCFVPQFWRLPRRRRNHALFVHDGESKWTIVRSTPRLDSVGLNASAETLSARRRDAH